MVDRSGLLPPLSLYVHFPWCIRKCPYCDFNSHQANSESIPEEAYVAALLRDLENELSSVQDRKLNSIFFGGGTPGLMTASGVGKILSAAEKLIGFSDAIEITLETNPGAAEQSRFRGYQMAGVNRISLGAQSFSDRQLKALGRIHEADEIRRAVDMLHKTGLVNFNLDLMFALPGQNTGEAMADLQQAIALAPPHLSWYQLTVEPNTVFYRERPVLPDEEQQYDILQTGYQLLKESGYEQYETSAFSTPGKQCAHNRNYWEFGDYLGIGAGAHGKVTLVYQGKLEIHRRQKTRVPEHYLKSVNPCSGDQILKTKDLACEFSMNGLRLVDGVPKSLFVERTGLSWTTVVPIVEKLIDEGLLLKDPHRFATTPKGALMLNSILERFL